MQVNQSDPIKVNVETVRAILDPLVATVKEQCFIKTYSASDEEALGLVISKYFQWCGDRVLESAAHALEDSNFHKEAAIVWDLKEGA